MRFFRKLKKGFTLVELVVVIAVIAILAAVSVGAYFGITDSANNSKLEQETKQLHTAIQTISLGTHDNQSLSSDGLRVKSLNQFKADLKFATGEDYEVLTGSPTTISRKTVVLSHNTALLQSSGLYTTYTTFEYFTPEVSGKRIVADVVDGSTKIHKYNFTYNKNAEPVEYTRIYWKNPTKFSEDNTYVHTVHDDGSNNGWPGEKMTVYIATEDIYTAEIQTNATKIVFHVGTDEGREEGDNRNQWSVDIDENGIPTDTPYYNDGAWVEAPVAKENITTKGKTMYFNSIINDRPGFKVYAYNTNGNFNHEFPGEEMTRVEGRNDYMHSYTFDDDYLSIVITNANNGNADAHKFSQEDISLEGFSEETPYYNGTDWVELPAAPGETVAEPTPVINRKVYYANKSWTNVNVYTWNGNNESNGEWPGVALSKMEGSEYVYKTTIPSYYTGFKFATTDGTANVIDQTGDLSFEGYDAVNKPFWNGVKWTPIPDDSDIPDKPLIKTVTLYLINEAGWTTNNIYYWGGSNSPEWPGIAMTQVDDSIVYKTTIPADVKGFLFTNGEGVQTADLSLPTDENIYYNNSSNTWVSSYTPDTGEGENPGEEPSDPVVEAIVYYFKPNDNWKQSNARFAAVFMNGDKTVSTWVDAEHYYGDIYTFTQPTDENTYKYIIICRMKGGNSVNDWSNKWNQSGDIPLDEISGNFYDISGKNVWDTELTISWTTYTETVVLMGSFEDSNWNKGVNFTNNNDGTYTSDPITLKNNDEFKFVFNGSWYGVSQITVKGIAASGEKNGNFKVSGLSEETQFRMVFNRAENTITFSPITE